MEIDLRRDPPTAQYIAAVKETEIDAQEVRWSDGSSLVLFVQALVLGTAAAVVGWALGDVVRHEASGAIGAAALMGSIAATVFVAIGWWSMKREAEQSRRYVDECLVEAGPSMMAALTGYVRNKPRAEAYVEKVRRQGRPVMAFEVSAISKMSIDTLCGVGVSEGPGWGAGEMARQ